MAFYCWVYWVFKDAIDNRSWDEYYPATKEMKRWHGLRDVVGYLIDFSDQWKIHGAPMWVEHDVPFHYIWHDGLATNDRFRYWDPITLNAYNESTDEFYREEKDPTVDPLTVGSIAYDDWLQVLRPRSENTPDTEFEQGVEYCSPRIRFFIEDFEGWHKRPLSGMSASETALLSSLYYHQDVQSDGSPYRIFIRWRERLVNPYGLIESTITKPFRLNTYVVRETYKFRYLGYQEHLHSGRSLLSRLDVDPVSDPPSPMTRSPLIGDAGERTLGRPSAADLRLRSRRDQGRQRSASPTPSRTSTRSQSSHMSRRKDREDGLLQGPRSARLLAPEPSSH